MAQEEAKRAFSERKRNILYLVHQYLNNMGYEKAAETIKVDAHLQSEYTICDNIDLDAMYLEYCSYYHMKFQKFPSIIKKIDGNSEVHLRNPRKLKSARAALNPTTARTAPAIKSEPRKEISAETIIELDSPLALTDSLKIKQISHEKSVQHDCGDGVRVYPPLSDCEYYSQEWKEMAETICRDIIKKDLGVAWKNIYGNTKIISLIKEAVLLPLEQPSLFSSNIKPWKSVLLHGPPGTGKSLIAKALCTETLGRVTFFRICPSTIISKWRGESEKTIRVLFEVARYYAPSIIFFDEIEALTSRRDSGSEHEASKRFKNEFLSLLDGVGEDNSNIFILATTNLPWEMDLAFLRRFEKKILTDMPNTNERKSIIKSFLPSTLKLSESLLDKLAESSFGFTGDEIRVACKEVAMKQIRYASGSQKNTKRQSHIPEEDILVAFEQTSPICAKTYQRYIDWNNSHGNKV
ncbi:unnamed protein product [Hermetia illucens]|uniref:AAA+ ATPase domain-containing protein n=1 Tax=Hermetia illucens TaxID=343691 RepID=A0A7R8UU42_HERIL|nr:katanin p60 ATPase-containing subunit A-like 2 [Hermetia illucens]CAD7087084.1 unnamed protein product [Hermetia illucens]